MFRPGERAQTCHFFDSRSSYLRDLFNYPSCNEVKKIAPHNYSTSNLSESELTAQGYTVCKRCH